MPEWITDGRSRQAPIANIPLRGEPPEPATRLLPLRHCRQLLCFGLFGPCHLPQQFKPGYKACGEVSLSLADAEVGCSIGLHDCEAPTLFLANSNGTADGLRQVSKPFNLFADSDFRIYVPPQQLLERLSVHSINDYHVCPSYGLRVAFCHRQRRKPQSRISTSVNCDHGNASLVIMTCTANPPIRGRFPYITDLSYCIGYANRRNRVFPAEFEDFRGTSGNRFASPGKITFQPDTYLMGHFGSNPGCRGWIGAAKKLDWHRRR